MLQGMAATGICDERSVRGALLRAPAGAQVQYHAAAKKKSYDNKPNVPSRCRPAIAVLRFAATPARPRRFTRRQYGVAQ